MGWEMGKSKRERYDGRDSNFEVLRIISILLIILFHCSFSGKEGWLTAKFDLNHVWSVLFQSWGLVGVHSFLFISCNFLIEREENFKIAKILQIILETIFYSFVMCLVSYLLGGANNRPYRYNKIITISINGLVLVCWCIFSVIYITSNIKYYLHKFKRRYNFMRNYIAFVVSIFNTDFSKHWVIWEFFFSALGLFYNGVC